MSKAYLNSHYDSDEIIAGAEVHAAESTDVAETSEPENEPHDYIESALYDDTPLELPYFSEWSPNIHLLLCFSMTYASSSFGGHQSFGLSPLPRPGGFILRGHWYHRKADTSYLARLVVNEQGPGRRRWIGRVPTPAEIQAMKVHLIFLGCVRHANDYYLHNGDMMRRERVDFIFSDRVCSYIVDDIPADDENYGIKIVYSA